MAIRVLQIVTQMERNGLETMLMNYYRNIDRKQVQFDFLVHRTERKDYDDEIESLGGRIYRMPRLNPFSPAYYRELNQFFLDHPEYRVVHSHLDCMAGVPLIVAKKNGVPHRIAHSHNSNQVHDLKYPLKLVFKNIIPFTANKLFACSTEAGEWMFGKHSFHVLNNAIDARKYIWNEESRVSIRNELGIPIDAVVLGHVGRFLAQKNHQQLINIFNDFANNFPTNAYLLLVGEGELMDEIMNKVTQFSLMDRVIFTGIRSDVFDILQAMDVFVMPSLFEGLPLVLVEAQAAGLPCVISDKVPEESIKIPELVSVAKLDDSELTWRRKILEALDIPRKDAFDDIVKAGFDIAANARELQNYYLELWNKEGM